MKSVIYLVLFQHILYTKESGHILQTMSPSYTRTVWSALILFGTYLVPK